MATASASSLIAKIHSIFHNPVYRLSLVTELRMCLRNLTVHLVCLRNVADDDTNVMKSLVSRIDVAIARIPICNSNAQINFANDFFVHAQVDNLPGLVGRLPGLVDGLPEIDCHAEETFMVMFFGFALTDSLREVNCLAKEVKDEWYTSTMPNCLTLDDVLQIADSILHSIADFWILVFSNKILNPNVRDVMHEFEAQTRFLRDFLLFAKRCGVQDQQWQNLLNHARPFVLDVACLFMIDGLLSIHDLVEELQSKCPRMDPQVFQVYTQILLTISALDQIDAAVLKDFISSLIALLWHIIRYSCHDPRHSDSLKALYECLRLSRFILKKQLQNNNGDFEEQTGVLIRDAGIVICSLYLTGVDSPYLLDLLQRFDVLQAHVNPESKSLKENALDVGDSTATAEEISDGKVQNGTATTSHQSSSTPEVVGFQDAELTSILDRLTRGSKQLRLVPISGMAGLGKTTLALKVYNHRSVRYGGFQAHAWCPVSQVFHKKRVLLQLLNQIQPGNHTKKSEDELANKLRQSLKKKRYLILLDDVWTPKVWESLRPSFPDDATQSRILLTTRLHSIVPHALPDEQPYFLRLREENECLEIIEMKLLHKVVSSIELGKFAKLCKGLPLTAVLVAGLLSTTVQEGWEEVLDQLSSGGISQMEQYKIALELSYKNLPEELKLCFMYFGAFPEDEEIYTKKFIRLWMAEGFVAKKQDLLEKRVEDIARGYLDDLIQRNLVTVDKKRSIGGVKTCRIHDLLHEFCLMKGKKENLFHLLLQRNDELSDFNEPYNMKRLSIHSGALHFKESRLFCPQAHSLSLFTTTENIEDVCLSDMLFIIQTFKLLKVLNIDRIWCTGIPSEIGLLTRLTYLSISFDMSVIPSSIGNLSNLETLIIRFLDSEAVSLPHTIWDLQNLKYLFISEHYSGFSLPAENMEISLSLLEAICGVIFYMDGSMEKQMSKFPNIRRLKCRIQQREKSSEELNKIVLLPEFLSQLESLTLYTESILHYELNFGCAESLQKVTLEGFVLSREEIAVIGNLPNLEVLKLMCIFFIGGKMEMEEGEFSKLRILELRGSSIPCDLETWTATEDEQLPCLKKLVVHMCPKLNELPYCLESSLTLEEIELFDCSSALESLVREIEEVQKDFGNSIKVQIRRNINEAEMMGEDYPLETFHLQSFLI